MKFLDLAKVHVRGGDGGGTAPSSTPATTWGWARTTPCSPWSRDGWRSAAGPAAAPPCRCSRPNRAGPTADGFRGNGSPFPFLVGK